MKKRGAYFFTRQLIYLVVVFYASHLVAGELPANRSSGSAKIVFRVTQPMSAELYMAADEPSAQTLGQGEKETKPHYYQLSRCKNKATADDFKLAVSNATLNNTRFSCELFAAQNGSNKKVALLKAL